MPRREIVPLYDRVLVRRVVEQAHGGIQAPDVAREKVQEGEVVAVGNGRLTERGDVIPCWVAVGDLVMFAKFAGTEVKLDPTDIAEEDHLFMREDEIMAIVKASGVVKP